MDIQEAIKLRRSIREYKDKPIPKDALEKIIDAARFAPTARGEQPWEFIVVTERTTLQKIGEITAPNGNFISSAGVVVVVFCRDTKYYLEDGCAATQNILLTAAGLGIGSCWVAGDKKPYCSAINKLLGVPDPYKLISILSLGYPAAVDAFRIKEKRSLSDILHWERF